MSLKINELVQQTITRSIEMQVYKALRENNLIPDRALYLNNEAGYKAAEINIMETKGFVVRLFGHGSSDDRENLFVPKMVITGDGFFEGSMAMDPLPFYEPNAEGGFDKLLAPYKSSNYRFNLEMVSNKTDQDNHLEAIKAVALPNLGYIPYYNDEARHLLIQYGSVRNMPDFNHGLIKKTYSYAVIDVFENIAYIVGKVARVKDIKVKDAEDDQTINHVYR